MRSIIKFLLSTFIFMASASFSQTEILFNDTHGQSTPFSSLKGKWVFINYWAGWCQTCVDEIPEFNRFYQSHQKEQVALFAVNFDALPLFEQKNLIKRYNISYPNLLKDPANDLHLGDITGVPVTFIFNPKGQLVKTLYGGQTAKTLEQVIAENAAKTKVS
nr:TlpA disulfide reductase family protein [Legionella maioricensis]